MVIKTVYPYISISISIIWLKSFTRKRGHILFGLGFLTFQCYFFQEIVDLIYSLSKIIDICGGDSVVHIQLIEGDPINCVHQPTKSVKDYGSKSDAVIGKLQYFVGKR